MAGKREQAFFAKKFVGTENTVDGAAKSGLSIFAIVFAVEPILEKGSDHPVAGFKALNARSDGKDFSGGVGADGERFLQIGGIFSAHHEDIAIVKRNGFDGDKYLTRARRLEWNGIGGECVDREIAGDADGLGRLRDFLG